MKTTIKLSALAILVLALCFKPLAQTVIFTPSDDASVFQNGPDSNGGDNINMTIRNQFGGTDPYYWGRDGLVNFDIASIPVNAEIISAKLNLYYHYFWDNNPAGRPLNCYRIAEAWDEMTVTWNNQPEYFAQPTATAIVPNNVGQWMTWDVTSDVQEIISNPNAVNYGWKITDEQYWGGVNIPITYFYTKENNDFIPYLEVVIIPAEQPDWEPIGGTQFSMTVLAAITLDDEPFVAEGNNMAGAFGPGGESDCRAIGFGQDGLWNFTIVSNAEQDDELISFKIWDGISSVSYSCNETIVFEDNAIVGTPDNPFLLSVNTFHQQEINLNENWNWISFNIHPEDTSIESVFGALGNDIHQVKNQYKSATWHGFEHGWFGDLLSISEGEGYLAKMINPVESFVVTGDLIDPATPIPLTDGWNWIGYFPQQPLPVEDALANLQGNALQIKAQSLSASWFESTGWIGDLTMMEPGQGYKLNMLNPDVLIYHDPITAKQYTVSHLKQSGGLQISGGNSMNMVVIAEIQSDTEPEVVAVFNQQGQCVAIASPFEYENSRLWYFTVVGNVPGEILRFKLMDKDLPNAITCIETPLFTNNATLGSPEKPFMLTTLTEDANPQNTFEGFKLGQNYPNPFCQNTSIEYVLPKPANVKLLLTDVFGRQVLELAKGQQTAGQHSTVIERGLLNPGMYFYCLEAQTAKGVYRKTRKLIVN